MGYRVSVDTGGTFTDVVVADEQGVLHLAKAPTDLERAFQSIQDGLAQLAPGLGVAVSELLARTDSFTYGTTRATNAIVERKPTLPGAGEEAGGGEEKAASEE